MPRMILPVLRLIAAVIWLGSGTARGQLVINELLFNPPGSDAPNEYIELRGVPNLIIPAGTYLISVDGDTNHNPGAIKNVFDLSGRVVGGNGFLVLLQKNSLYAPNTNAAILLNTNSGPGWGSGSGSSVGHRGDNGITNLENAPVTFLLIQTT